MLLFLDLLRDKENEATDFAVFIHFALSDQDDVILSFLWDLAFYRVEGI